MLAETWLVAWFEYRRHLRSRFFWQRLLGGALLVFLLTALLSWALSRFTQAGMERAYAMMLQFMLILHGFAGLVAPFLMTPRIFSDKTRRGETPDIYMTALHPLGIVLGRLMAVGMHFGLMLLVLFPVGAYICQLAGFPLLFWVQVLGMTWLAALMWASLVARWLNKYLPGGLTPPERETVGISYGLMWIAAVPFILAIQVIFPVLGLELSMPLMLMIPPLIPEQMLKVYSIGGWALPAWLVSLPFVLGFTLLGAIATAQRLGWWSDVAYRWQRWLGTVLYWLFFGVNMAIFAGLWVRSAAQAEQLVFFGMMAGAVLYLLVVSPLLGYYGVALRPRHGRYALPPPLGGLLWEWVMVLGIASVAWQAVGLGSGYWVEPARWLAWTVCLWSLLVMLQSGRGVLQMKYLFVRDGTELWGWGFPLA
ncbi:MAG: hypothetical protein ABDI19_07955 [Armatimonadota bacterium]